MQVRQLRRKLLKRRRNLGSHGEGENNMASRRKTQHLSDLRFGLQGRRMEVAVWIFKSRDTSAMDRSEVYRQDIIAASYQHKYLTTRLACGLSCVLMSLICSRVEQKWCTFLTVVFSHYCPRVQDWIVEAASQRAINSYFQEIDCQSLDLNQSVLCRAISSCPNSISRSIRRHR